VHGDLDSARSGVGQTCVGQPHRKRLDQVDGFAADDRGNLPRHCRVVDRLRQVVGTRCGRDVGLDNHVDPEQLPVAALLGMDTVEAAHAQAAQLDPVGAHESDSLGASTGEA
jgi:hypothetical protein